jgi:hypothetical protein
MFFLLAEYFDRKVLACAGNMGCGIKPISHAMQIRQSEMKLAGNMG